MTTREEAAVPGQSPTTARPGRPAPVSSLVPRPTPLEAFALRAEAERVRWPVLAADFEVVGRVDRGRRPGVTTYAHRRTGGLLHLDDRGRPYRHLPVAGAGRFVECGVRPAVFAARLHLATAVPAVGGASVAGFEVVATKGHLRLLRAVPGPRGAPAPVPAGHR